MFVVSPRLSFRHLPWLLLLVCVGVSCSKPQPVEEVRASEEDIKNATEAKTPEFVETDWPWWRGPTRNGIATGATPPTSFGPDENVAWVAEVPGRGHASPTVVGDRIFLPSGVDEKQVVLCYSRENGELLWETDVFEGGLAPEGHSKSSQASATIACDDKHEFAVFLNNGDKDKPHVWVVALDREGEVVWKTATGPMNPQFGYAPSPIIYRGLVIVAAEPESPKGSGFLAALDRKSGEMIWRKPRTGGGSSYSSPVIVPGRDGEEDQLVLSGGEKIISYDPLTGEENWSVDGANRATVGTVVWDGDLLFAAGGYPSVSDQLVAVKRDGSEVVWTDKAKIYIPSLLALDGKLYAASDDGRGYCWDAATGKVLWQKRLRGGFDASPVAVGDLIFLASTNGEVIVIEANGEKYVEVARNKMGTEINASPVIVDGAMFVRVAEGREGDRREKLYCVK